MSKKTFENTMSFALYWAVFIRLNSGEYKDRNIQYSIKTEFSDDDPATDNDIELASIDKATTNPTITDIAVSISDYVAYFIANMPRQKPITIEICNMDIYRDFPHDSQFRDIEDGDWEFRYRLKVDALS